ncbi:MAG TPA: pantoate--beta-alanine ligase [Tepidisphaeraceae bacterium]|nr:pantoate--beta-alanine ligase [Tepidisphaeraceae bacterium]
MKVLHTISEMRAERATLGPLALVPTMGALHAGHMSLIEVARTKAPHVAVSIFVNPAQFGPREDFTKYPRPIVADLQKCEAAGVGVVFNPSEAEMYPGEGVDTVIDFPQLTNVLEGKHRPGHFRGVCLIVAKLFNIIQPNIACFGQKDFQQLRVLNAMVESLNWPIAMVGCPTLRDPDGMAMSSRNQYLSPQDRQRGLAISKALFAARDLVATGVKQASRLTTAMQHMLLAQHLLIDYIASVDPLTLKPVEIMTGPTVLAIAARVGATRLIDNIVVEPKE